VRLSYDDETEAFRAELAAWLDANAPTAEEMAVKKTSSANLPDWAKRWQRRLFDAGWLVPGWPPELGGRNATAAQTLVYMLELAERGLPRALNPQGLGIIAPSIKEFGTPEQQERWLVPTLRGEITWCLGMSEPDAGSDLASLRTRGELREDGWHISGQKVWTSGAHDADWCLCFVRTEPEAPKHKGISAFVIDMSTPGVRTRPLPELTDPDQADFNEVFFDDAVVPVDNMLGERGQGWSISVGSLGHERGMLWISTWTALSADVQELVKIGIDRPELGADPRYRDAVAACYVDATAMGALGQLGFAKFVKGEPAPEHLILKLYGSTAHQRLYEATVSWLGPEGFEREHIAPSHDIHTGSWENSYLHSFAQTIAGGTNEIQRTIIAERVLGLPRG
jgi:alkylation response protein AidB-like acyl-CoA dehydrogenase